MTAINREKLMQILLAAGVVALVFLWTHMLFASARESVRQESGAVQERIVKASALVQNIQTNGAASQRLDTGLLTYLQTLGGSLNISEKILSIRPVAAAGNIEQISLRLEHISLSEMTAFLIRLEQYTNVAIRSFTFTKRYDNPQEVDISMEVTKEG